MARLIALEWDSAEARVVVAQGQRSGVVVEQCLAISLESLGVRSATEIGKRIGEALLEAGIAGGDVSIAVGRSSIELRFLMVPPVPPDELPDLIRFQAARQFSQSFDDGELDFVPIGSPTAPVNNEGTSLVLAAAMSAEMLKSIRATCAAAGLQPKHLALRPFAAASLVTDSLAESECVLTIDLLAAEADLTVVSHRQAVFPRTTRLATDTKEEEPAALAMEVRRTLAAAQNQLPSEKVKGILLFGQREESEPFRAKLTSDVGLPVRVIDPLDQVTLADSARSMPTSGRGRFAPLIGLLHDEARGVRHEIDFLSPRRRPNPPDYSRWYALGGTLAGAIALLIAFMVYWNLSALDAEIEQLTADNKKLEKTLKAAKPTLDHVKLVDEFAAGQIDWVAELARLSEKLPPADQAIVGEVKGGATTTGGRLLVTGGVKKPNDVAQLESGLRDAEHRVSGQGSRRDAEEKSYPWRFDETITISREAATKSGGAAR